MVSVNAYLTERMRTNTKSLIIYYPAGYPDMDQSLHIMQSLAKAGADVLEIGFPYSDPMMDGGIIQDCGQHALAAGYTPKDDFAMAAQLTASVDIPVVVMTYYNIAWHYQRPDNLAGFAQMARDAGLAGAILPDLPAKEGTSWDEQAFAHGLETIYLVSPTSDASRIQAVAEHTTGFVYASSHMGVTGVTDSLSSEAEPLVQRIRSVTNAPIGMGIGISTPDQARQVAQFADGIIVGSAVIRAIKEEGLDAGVKLVQRLKAAIS